MQQMQIPKPNKCPESGEEIQAKNINKNVHGMFYDDNYLQEKQRGSCRISQLSTIRDTRYMGNRVYFDSLLTRQKIFRQ